MVYQYAEKSIDSANFTTMFTAFSFARFLLPSNAIGFAYGTPYVQFSQFDPSCEIAIDSVHIAGCEQIRLVMSTVDDKCISHNRAHYKGIVAPTDAAIWLHWRI